MIKTVQQATLENKIRHETARASHIKDTVKAREAAYKAWDTIRARQAQEKNSAILKNSSILSFMDEVFTLPPKVMGGTYLIHPPLIKKSKLTYVANGGVGKELSDGWVLNFAIGCTFGCRFCYVDEIHKKFSFKRAGDIVYNDWGNYFSVPENLDEAMEQTNWSRWTGEEVMLSSTHDPYLPMLHRSTRKILEKALPAGVKFCIQTRSPLVERDFDLLKKYTNQVRLQVSIATMDAGFSRIIEQRVVSPSRRMETLKKAKENSITTGVIIAPVFPSIKARPNLLADLDAIASALSEIRPDRIYGESVHIRGLNLAYIESAIKETLQLDGFDRRAGRLFNAILQRHGLSGKWWPEH